MKNKNSIKITSIILLPVFCITLGYAGVVLAKTSDETHQQKKQSAQKPHNRMMQHQFRQMAKTLGLSTQQKQEMKAIHLNGKEENKANHAEMKEFKEEMRIITGAEEFDELAFQALYSRYETTIANMALLKAKTRHQIRQLLTDEQQQKWLIKNKERTGINLVN
jgi:Spy/CpxP family protein refolding chaperone